MAEEPQVTAQRKKTQQIRNDQTDQMEEAARKVHAEMPPPGYQRREDLKRQEDALQEEIDRITAQIMRGKVDEENLKIMDEIASRTQYLWVSNADPTMKYAWVSKNNHMVHIRRLENEGWITVQGSDPEALELKGTSGIAAGTGTPDTTRQIGDVVLMKIPLKKYAVLQARERARVLEMHRASASRLANMANQWRKRGIIVRTDDPIMGEMLEGPPIKPRRFSSAHAMQSGILTDHYFREGTIPGMEINQR